MKDRTVVGYVGDQEHECRVRITDLHYALAARHLARAQLPVGDRFEAARMILTLAALTGRRLRSTDVPLPSGLWKGKVMDLYDYLEDEEPE